MSTEISVKQGSEKNVSMLHRFTNVIAGTGAFFAALHVFIGYMSLDKTPNETTGEIPSLFDNTEYLYYLLVAVFFAATLLVSMLARRLPAAAILPSAATVTYLLLLYDAEILLKGKMTFILFSLFVLVGNLAVSLYRRSRTQRELYRYVVAAIGVFAAGWAIAVYFRVPHAEQLLFGAFKPLKELDGLSAVLRYERMEALVALAKEGYRDRYLWSAVAAFVSAAVFLLLPRQKWIIRAVAVLSLPYMLIAFSFGEMTYFPMFCIVPMLIAFLGIMAYAVVEPIPAATAEETAPEEDAPAEAEESPLTEDPTDEAREESGESTASEPLADETPGGTV